MSLHDHLVRRIQHDGPLSVADFMVDCLLHPDFGYYTTKHPFGRSGDFITAPEISQMFGEIIGLCLAQAWLDQGRPAPFTLAELGPGRGTLMADILRAARLVPGFTDAARIVLVEASAALIQEQKSRLTGYDVTWVGDVSQLPDAPLFLIANEFFDALPIRQHVRDGTGWRERQVGLVGDDLAFGLSQPSPISALKHRIDDTSDGAMVEFAPAAPKIIETISTHIANHGGAALIIDYGDWRSQGDTLQAVQGHAPADPLKTPGQADLTAHVDFEALATAATCPFTKVTPQGVFLERMGITQRAQALAAKLIGTALDAHVAAHRRLTHPEEMGNLFKVMGLYPPNATAPPGLDP